jgi:phage tail sheath protein FI
VTNWAQFERAFGGMTKDCPMPLAVYQFFQNGGRRAYILRVLPKNAVESQSTALAIDGFPQPVTIKAVGGGVWGDSIRVEVRVHQFSRNPGNEKDKRPYLFDFRVLLKDSANQYDAVETFSALGGLESGDRFYAAVINRDSEYIRIVPEDGTFSEVVYGSEVNKKTADEEIKWETATHVDLTGGDDGNAAGPTADDFYASLQELDRIDDASILVIPGETEVVVNKGIGYVENRKLGDMFYIIDPPKPVGDDPTKHIDAVKQFVTDKITTKSSYAALYFPWVEIPDPYSTLSGATRRAPPSGMIAGLYARTDNTRGVWKAPAGTEASLLGVVGLTAKVSDAEQDTLNPIGVNCIRQFPAAGIVVWGARTLATSSNPEYRYVPVRRTMNFLKVSLFRGTQWVVFEPNDERLWSAIKFNINGFMMSQFRAGAFQGGNPAEAYVVKCDAENNIQATIDQGQVHILVAFAPLKPAEFVIIHITQIRKE